MVAVDACCPIVQPISGEVTGYLAVLLAMGTPDQVGVGGVASDSSVC